MLFKNYFNEINLLNCFLTCADILKNYYLQAIKSIKIKIKLYNHLTFNDIKKTIKIENIVFTISICIVCSIYPS